jgi:hypothetical protein
MSVATRTCLPNRCLETALVYLLTSRSLHISGSTCYCTRRYSQNRDAETRALQPLSTRTVFQNRMLGGGGDIGAKPDKMKRRWTKLHNKEFHNLYSMLNIIRTNKWRSGYVAHMGGMGNTYKILLAWPEGATQGTDVCVCVYSVFVLFCV